MCFNETNDTDCFEPLGLAAQRLTTELCRSRKILRERGKIPEVVASGLGVSRIRGLWRSKDAETFALTMDMYSGLPFISAAPDTFQANAVVALNVTVSTLVNPARHSQIDKSVVQPVAVDMVYFFFGLRAVRE